METTEALRRFEKIRRHRRRRRRHGRLERHRREAPQQPRLPLGAVRRRPPPRQQPRRRPHLPLRLPGGALRGHDEFELGGLARARRLRRRRARRDGRREPLRRRHRRELRQPRQPRVPRGALHQKGPGARDARRGRPGAPVPAVPARGPRHARALSAQFRRALREPRGEERLALRGDAGRALVALDARRDRRVDGRRRRRDDAGRPRLPRRRRRRRARRVAHGAVPGVVRPRHPDGDHRGDRVLFRSAGRGRGAPRLRGHARFYFRRRQRPGPLRVLRPAHRRRAGRQGVRAPRGLRARRRRLRGPAPRRQRQRLDAGAGSRRGEPQRGPASLSRILDRGNDRLW